MPDSTCLTRYCTISTERTTMPLPSVDIPHSTPWKNVFGLAQLTDDPHTWMLTGGLIRPVVIADMNHRRLFISMHPMYTRAVRPCNHTTTRYPPQKRNPAPQPSQRRCGNGREEVRHPAGLVSRIPSLRKEYGADRQTHSASYSENFVAFGNIPNSALLFAHSVDHPLTKAVDTLFQSPVPCAYSTSALEISSCHC